MTPHPRDQGIQTGSERWSVVACGGPVATLATATWEGRPVLLSTGADGTAAVWDSTGAELLRIRREGETVASAALAGNCLVTGGSDGHDGVLRVHTPVIKESGRIPGPGWSLELEHAEIQAVALGPGVVVAGWSGEIGVWDAATGRQLRSWPVPTTVRALAVAGDDLFAAGDDALVRRWDLATGAAGEPWSTDGDEVRALAVAGGRLAAGGFGGRVRVRDLASGAQTRVEGASPGWISSLALSGGEVAAGVNGVVTTWDLASGSVTGEHDGVAVALAGDRPVTGDAHGWVAGWAPEPWLAHTGEVWAVAVDGDVVVTGGDDGVLRVWSRADGRLRHALGEGPRIEAVVLAGGRVETGGILRPVQVWDVASGELLQEREGELPEPHAVEDDCAPGATVVAKDRTVVVAGYADGRVRAFSSSG